MKEPKKIAFAGDWHGNLNWGVSMINNVADMGVDTIVHLGDYGYTFTSRFEREINEACEARDVDLYFVDGNHDLHEYIWSHPLDEDGFHHMTTRVRAIPRGHRWRWWDLTWMGLGGATSVDRAWRTPMVEWWPTEAITEGQANKAVAGGRVDVMVAHDCPSEVPIPGISFENGIKYFPAQELRVADAHRNILRSIVDVVDPALYVHGHYHQFYDYDDGECRYVGLNMDDTMIASNLWIVESPFDMSDRMIERLAYAD